MSFGSVLGGVDVLALVMGRVVFLGGVAVGVVSGLGETVRAKGVGVVFALLARERASVLVAVQVVGFSVVFEDVVQFVLVVCFGGGFSFVSAELSVFAVPVCDEVLEVVLL